MGLLDISLRDIFKFSKRSSLENPSTSFAEFIESFGGGSKASSGVVVNSETAMKFAAVWACVRVLSEGVASLPLNVYVREGNSKKIATDHPVYELLHNEPNKNMTSFTWRETVQAHTTLRGNGFSRILRNEGARPISFEPLDSNDITVKVSGGQYFWYCKDVAINYDDLLHIKGIGFDGILGKSVISCAQESIGLGIAAEQFGSSFFGRGANLSGVLEHPGVLTDKGYEHLRKSWDNKYTGLDNAHKTAILEEGMKYHTIGIPPEDAQFLQTRKFQVTDIARWFRVPPHMIADLERSTFSNIEQQSIDFIIHSLRPWLVKWEQELNRKIFATRERGKYFCEFNLEGLLRGDAQARAAFYKDLFYLGALSPNEIRAMENKNPIEGGDKYYILNQMVPVDKIEEFLLKKGNGAVGA